MQHFDGSIAALVRAGVLDLETGIGYATNPGNLRLELSDVADEAVAATPAPVEEHAGSGTESDLLLES